MTPNQAKIVLTNPCSENWNAMQVDPIGRFCQSCRQSVIDFSTKSDEEIKALLQDKQGKKLCGRFYVHQVERIRIEIDQNILVSDSPFWQKFLVIVLVCFGADFLGCDFVFAQTETDSVPAITEQVDSLVSEPLAETDSTLEIGVDSLQKPDVFKTPESGRILPVDPKLFLGYIMGEITFVPEQLLPSPERKIQLLLTEPEEDPVSYLAEMNVSKTNSSLPEKPKKKPTLPENAIIADTGERRKPRRS
jgi:hypothetical protein